MDNIILNFFDNSFWTAKYDLDIFLTNFNAVLVVFTALVERIIPSVPQI